MKNSLTFKQATETENYTFIPILGGGYGAIGFKTFSNAELFAKENGGEVYHFINFQDSCWWLKNGKANNEYTPQNYIDNCIDDVDIVYSESFFECFRKKAAALLCDFNKSIDEVVNEMRVFSKIVRDLETILKIKKETETIIYNNSTKDFGSVANSCMAFKIGESIYEIGVYFNNQIHSEG